ncbi:hypothetical protein ACQ86D_00560 [Streptomyces galilaeus]
MTDQASPALWRFIQDDDPDAFTLIVETANGQYVRRIRPALPLPSGVEHGPGAEVAAHTAAATWGLSDFVFQSAYASKGSGRRELGDRLLLAGGRGAVIVMCRVQPRHVGHRLRQNPGICPFLELDFTDRRSLDTGSELRRYIDYMCATPSLRRYRSPSGPLRGGSVHQGGYSVALSRKRVPSKRERPESRRPVEWRLRPPGRNAVRT